MEAYPGGVVFPPTPHRRAGKVFCTGPLLDATLVGVAETDAQSPPPPSPPRAGGRLGPRGTEAAPPTAMQAYPGGVVLPPTPHRRAGKVFCTGPLLDVVQRARLFNDAKHFVDMPLRKDPEDVLMAFQNLPASVLDDPVALRAFVDEHFDAPGAELHPHIPAELRAEPPFVTQGAISDPSLREFSVALHQFWPALCRVTAPDVAAAPHRYTALPRRHPVVLPGGRFRETYYWDSLWIAQGLLASGMPGLAKGLAQNLLDDVARFGFVPNGGRSYYLNRSQPPVLAAMVASVARHMDPREEAIWLQEAVPLLRREYDWWMAGDRAVLVGGTKLNRFFAGWDQPRPESYWQDLETSEGCPKVCREMASAAETGWDFSGRWARPTGAAKGEGEGSSSASAFRLEHMQATSVLPVCLNSIMYHAELTLANLCEAVARNLRVADVEQSRELGLSFRCEEAQALLVAAEARRKAMDAHFWRPHLGRWSDVWLPEAVTQVGHCTAEELHALATMDVVHPPTIADFAPPLWAGLATPDQATSCMEALHASGLMGPAGVMTTTVESGEQWDAPNAWAPMQMMLIEGLRESGAPGGATLAADLAQRWVGTCYAAWRSTGAMHEKYNALSFGAPAGGGEYEPQEGFGWSNGVVLGLLSTYGQELTPPTDRGSHWSPAMRPIKLPAPWKVQEAVEAFTSEAEICLDDTTVPDLLFLPGSIPEEVELSLAAVSLKRHATEIWTP